MVQSGKDEGHPTFSRRTVAFSQFDLTRMTDMVNKSRLRRVTTSWGPYSQASMRTSRPYILARSQRPGHRWRLEAVVSQAVKLISERQWTSGSLTSLGNSTEGCNPRTGKSGESRIENSISCSCTFLHHLATAPDRRLPYIVTRARLASRNRRHCRNRSCVPPIYELRKTRGKDIQPAWTQGTLVLPPDKHAMATRGGNRGGGSGWFNSSPVRQRDSDCVYRQVESRSISLVESFISPSFAIYVLLYRRSDRQCPSFSFEGEKFACNSLSGISSRTLAKTVLNGCQTQSQ